ncbi:hypothetical protein ACWA2C_16140 [Priestia megaterium]
MRNTNQKLTTGKFVGMEVVSDSLIKGAKLAKCTVCGCYTYNLSVDFDRVPMCSKECDDKYYDEYEKACSSEE